MQDKLSSTRGLFPEGAYFHILIITLYLQGDVYKRGPGFNKHLKNPMGKVLKNASLS
jgi:hypothetical protein